MLILFCIPFNTMRAAGGSFGDGDGSATHPYIVEDEADLRAIATGDVTAYYKLVTDISLSSAWTPIGDHLIPFSGGFDGSGFVISNLFTNPGNDYVGLFGETNGATIKNTRVIIDSAGVNGDDYVGGIVGRAVNSNFLNCHVSGGSVTGGKNLYGIAGGFAGQVSGGSVIGCSAEVNVNGAAYIGGFVGYASADANIKGSYATCNVTAVGSVVGDWFAGGFVGFAYSGVTITSCYATGNVDGGNLEDVGGFAGSTNGVGPPGGANPVTVEDCYATGNVTGYNYVGGFVGYTIYGSIIDNCNSLGQATATKTPPSRAGGFAGTVDTAGEIITNCAYNDEVNSTGFGGNNSGGTASSTGAPGAAIGAIIAASPAGDWAPNMCGDGELVWAEFLADLYAAVIHYEDIDLGDVCSETNVNYLDLAYLADLDPLNVVPDAHNTKFTLKVMSVGVGVANRDGALLVAGQEFQSVNMIDVGVLVNATMSEQPIVFEVVPYYDVSGLGNVFSCGGELAKFTLSLNLVPIPDIRMDKQVEICNDEAPKVTYRHGTDGDVPTPLMNYEWTVLSGGNPLTDAASGSAAGVINVGSDLYFDPIKNLTDEPQVVVFEVTPYAKSCPQAYTPMPQVTVTVYPEPQIADINFGTICSNDTILITRQDLMSVSGNVVPTVTTYDWVLTSTTPSAAITPASGSNDDLISIEGINNPLPITVTAVYTVTPTYASSGKSCPGDPFTITVVVNPTPEIDDMTRTVCSNDNLIVLPIHGIDGIVPLITRYEWDVTGGSPDITVQNSTGNSIGFINLGSISNDDCDVQDVEITVTPYSRNYAITLWPPSLTLTGECEGEPFKINVTVNPTPEITNFTETICSGDALSITPECVVDGIVPTGLDYVWTVTSGNGAGDGGYTHAAPPAGCVEKDKTDADGDNVTGTSGIYTSINFGTINNYTEVPQTVVFRVVPITEDGCDGEPFTMTVTVNPKPQIQIVPATYPIIVCSNEEEAIMTEAELRAFHCNNIVPDGLTYNWVPNREMSGGSQINPPIWTDAHAGTSQGEINFGKIHSFYDKVINVYYDVTPTWTNGTDTCVGNPFELRVQVFPRPEIKDTVDTICSAGPLAWTWKPIHGFVGGIYGGNSGDSIVPGTNPATPATTHNTKTVYAWEVTSNAGGITGYVESPIYDGSSPDEIDLGTLVNPNDTAATIVFTVIPYADNVPYGPPPPFHDECEGDPFTITLVILPTPVLIDREENICSNENLIIFPYTDEFAGQIVPDSVRYTWIATPNANVDGVDDGESTDSIAIGVLSNLTPMVQFVTYTVTPTVLLANGSSCTGDNFTIDVIVYPTPEVNDVVDTICSDDSYIVTSNVHGVDGQIIPNAGNSLIVSTVSFPPLVITPSYVTTTTYRWDVDSIVSSEGDLGSVGVEVDITNSSALNATSINFGTFHNNTNKQQNVYFGVTPVATTVVVSILPPGITTKECEGEPFVVEITVNPVPDILDTTVFICSNTDVVFAMQDEINGTVPEENIRYDWTVFNATDAGDLEIDGALVDGSETGSTMDVITIGVVRNSCEDEQIIIFEVTPVDTLYGCNGHPFYVTLVVAPSPEIDDIDGVIICSNEEAPIFTPVSDCPSVIVPVGTYYEWDIIRGGDVVDIANGKPVVPNSSENTTAPGNIELGVIRNLTNVQQTVVFEVKPFAPPATGALSTDTCEGQPFLITLVVNPTPEICDNEIMTCSGEFVFLNYYDGEVLSSCPDSVIIVPAGTVYTWEQLHNTGVDRPNGDPLPAVGDSKPSNSTILLGELSNKHQNERFVTYKVTPEAGGCVGEPFILTVRVKPELDIKLIADNNVICKGDSVELFAIPSDKSFADTLIAVYEFYQDGKYIKTDSAYNHAGIFVSNLEPRNYPYEFQVIAKTHIIQGRDTLCESSSNIVEVLVKEKPTVTTSITGVINICSGGSVTAEAFALPVGTYSYVWYLDSVVVGNAKQVTVSGLDTAAAKQPYLLWVDVTPEHNGCTVTSDTIQIRVTDNPIADITVAQDTICAGEMVNISTNYEAGYTYEWRRNGSPISATSNVFSETLNTPGLYTYQVRKENKTGCSFDWSKLDTVIVEAIPQVELYVDNNIYCIDGGKATATVAVTPDSIGAYSYKLYRNGVEVSMNSVNTATGEFDLPTETTAGVYNYRIEATSKTKALCVSPRSNVVTVTVKAKPAVDIVTVPADATVCKGGSITATAVVTQPGNYNYTWYLGGVVKGNGQQITLNNLITSGEELSVTVVPVDGGNACDSTPKINIIVVDKPELAVQINGKDADTICVVGGTAVLTTEIVGGITGAGATYEWSLNGGLAIVGANESTYSPILTAPGVYEYRARMIPNDGLGCGSEWSDPVKVTVEAMPVVTLTLSSSPAYCLGTGVSAILDVAVANDNGLEYTYTLFTDGGPVTGGANAPKTSTDGHAQFTPEEEFANTYNYYVVAESAAGCAGQSNTVSVLVREKPEVTVVADRESVCEGGSITATATQPSPANDYNYTWKLGSVVVASGRGVSEVTVNNLATTDTRINVTVVPVDGDDACAVEEYVDFTVTSDPVVELSVNGKDAGLPDTICAGGTATITATIATTPATVDITSRTYEWSVNGSTAIVGEATNVYAPILTVPGTYTIRARVMATDSRDCGSDWSTPVNVVVEEKPIVTLNIGNNTYCAGGVELLTAVVTNAVAGVEYTYEWYENNTIVNSSDKDTLTANIAAGSYSYYVIAKSAVCQSVASNIVNVTVKAAPTASIELSRDTICPGGSVIATAVVTPAGGNYNYAWKLGGIPVGNGQQLIIENIQEGKHIIELEVNSVEGFSGCSGTAKDSVIVIAAPELKVEASDSILCNSGSVKLTASIFNAVTQEWEEADGSIYTYQWARNGIVVPGAERELNYQLLTAGRYEFTARVVLSDGTGCASEWSEACTVIVMDIEIPELVVKASCDDNLDIEIPITVNGSLTGLTYTVKYGTTTLVATENIPDSDPKLMVTIPADWAAGDYELDVEIFAEGFKCDYTTKIRVLADGLIEPRWDDVLVVNNNYETNGHFTFNAYQWYKNGVPVEGATGQYYSENGQLNGEYYVVMSGKDEYGHAVSFVTCPYSATLKAGIRISPVPAKPHQQLVLTVTGLTEEELVGATLEIYSMTGALQQRISKVTPQTYIEGIAVQSTYLARLTLANGTAQTLKFIVK